MSTHMLRKHQQNDNSKIHSSAGIHRDSRVISKIQPKIRIIHIFAPEIIQTDVANFRELVQSLTGKPTPSSAAATTSTSSGSWPEKNSDDYTERKLARVGDLTMEAFDSNKTTTAAAAAEGDYDQSYDYNYKPVISPVNKDYFGGYDRDSIQGGGGFLEVFDGVNDYFMQEIGEFSFVPMEANDRFQTHEQNHHRHQHQFDDNLQSLSYRG